MKTFSLILFFVFIAVELLWMIGFPIYKKIKRESIWFSCYNIVSLFLLLGMWLSIICFVIGMRIG